MKQRIITIFAVAAMAALSISLFAGCGEGDKNSETTTAPSSTAVQPTTAKGTLPKTTVPTTAGSAESQANNYNSSAEQSYNNENEAYHSDAQSNADENSGEASNSNSQSSADNNANNDPDYPEIPGEGEIVIHGDPSYVGTD